MTLLFGRTWFASVGELDVSDLDLSFEVERSVKREPNKCTVNIRNLKPESRAQVSQGGTVVLRVGYGENPPLLFRGDTRTIFSTIDGPTVITTISARDGGRAYSEARMSRSYQPGTSVTTVLRDAVDALGIGRGNLDDFVSSLQLRNRATTFAGGFVAAGPAHRVVSAILRGSGCRWSVQNGSLQIQRAGTPLQSRAVVIADDTGMVGSPTWDETGQRTQGRRGMVSVTVRIQPGLEPGRKVRLESRRITGDFEVKRAVYKGDTRSDDWNAELDLRALSSA